MVIPENEAPDGEALFEEMDLGGTVNSYRLHQTVDRKAFVRVRYERQKATLFISGSTRQE